MPVRLCDAGDLEFGLGLEVLVTATLEAAGPGGLVDVSVRSRSAAAEVPAWARAGGHETIDERAEGRGSDRRFVVRIRRGTVKRVLAPDLPARDDGLPLRTGGLAHTADLRSAAEAPAGAADATRGLWPIGAVPEESTPAYRWIHNDKDALWADDVADLTERATGAQWDATADVPWEAAKGLPDDIERAVAQLMTFIAQNEYAALYVPAHFLPHVNPEFTEMLLWLAGHVHDEARHVEVFTKRALAGGFKGHALRSTELSLHTLVEQRDFTAAALLLNVLGEGTFLDLLKFVEVHAPDEATAAAARLAHRDEQRHVHFGISHVRRVLGKDPERKRQLVAAVEGRAASLVSLTGVSPVLTESMTVMAAGSVQRAALSEAAAEVVALIQRMDHNRVRRLRAAGFDELDARHMSELHTPNLM